MGFVPSAKVDHCGPASRWSPALEGHRSGLHTRHLRDKQQIFHECTNPPPDPPPREIVPCDVGMLAGVAPGVVRKGSVIAERGRPDGVTSAVSAVPAVSALV